MVLVSLYWNWRQVEKSTMELAVKEALSSFNKDIVYRLWNANNGGGYVPATEQTPPNPFLDHIPERDIFTSSGTHLTLVNPAYMTRQVHKLGQTKYGIRAHITSLRPIRQANAADDWEIKALKKFETGIKEVTSEEMLDDQSYMRFMRPLVTDKSCLKCHAVQGYKEGDIRGGISISIPLKPYHEAAAAGQWPLLYGHLVIWILGVAGIISGNMFQRKVKLAKRLEFERMAGQISSNFVRLAPGKAEMGIERALASIGKFINTDRVYIFQFQDNETRLIKSHEWCREGTSPQIKALQDITPDNLPWWLAKIKNLEVLVISDRSNLSLEAGPRKELFLLKDTQASIAVPLVISDRFIGFLGADSVHKGRAWMEEDIILLQLVGETIVHALARDRAEKALENQTERLNRILHSTNVGTWEWNIQTGETILNERWAEIIGYTLEEISSQTIEKWNWFFHPDDLGTAKELLSKCFNHEKMYYNFEGRVRHKNGDWIWVQDCGKVATWTESGKPEWMYGTRTDINQQKQQEQERQRIFESLQQTQRLESLGVLAGGIAHFNNILMTIMGNAELTLDELPPLAPGRENIVEIINSSKNAAELCGQMLAYSGKGFFEKQNISLRHLIEDTVSMLKTSISKKSILNLNLKKNLPDIHVDRTQIRQILMNLVINASEAFGESSGFITISSGVVDHLEGTLSNGYVVEPSETGAHVYFEVFDTGHGFERQLIQRIFEPFFTTKFTGRGLGLSAVVGIVRGHKGALYVQSDPGKGSVFRVFFPAVTTPVDKAVTCSKEDIWHGKGTIMLVDDEDAVRAVTVKILQKFGLDVVTAIDGRQAIEIYRRRQSDITVVLLDLTMPQMNGEETFRELRKINPGVRVILASGYSKDVVSSRFTEKESVYCLQKPYTMDKLRSLLSSMITEISMTEEKKVVTD
jgi:PAS domain S-box-containing protein